jgi:nicotinamidase-related amidase
MAWLRVPYKMLLAPVPPFDVTADNTALLLIDAQHFTTSRSQGLGLLAAERGIEREFDEYYLQAEAALNNMATLVAACRARGLAVMHTVLSGTRPDRSDLSRQMRTSQLPLPAGDPLREIRPEVAPADGEPVFGRSTYSPFIRTGLLEALSIARIDTLLLAGMLANQTVWQAAREAADLDFGVVVVMDCCASETLAWHTQLRTGIVGGLIRQRSSGEVIEMLEGRRT